MDITNKLNLIFKPDIDEPIQVYVSGLSSEYAFLIKSERTKPTQEIILYRG